MTDLLTDEHIAHDLALVDAARYHRHFSGCYRTGGPICKEQSFSDNLLDKYEAALREVQRLRALCKEAYDELGINNFEAADLALIKALEVQG